LNLRLILAALGCAFLLAHLRALPQTLEDIDSINFAMGVESFDVAKHQPHPPGYPIFIAMAKASTRAVAVVAPGWDRDRRAAVGLAVWNVIAGALGAWVIFEFWMAAGLSAILAALAAFVAVSSPLFWLTASRPLTDTVGLVVALAVATLLLRGSAAFARETKSLLHVLRPRRSDHDWVAQRRLSSILQSTRRICAAHANLGGGALRPGSGSPEIHCRTALREHDAGRG